MDPTTRDVLFDSAEQPEDIRRVSLSPVDGYVLDPWSGLYQETEAAYQKRRLADELVTA